MSVPQIPFRRLPLVRRVNVALGKVLVKRALTPRICADSVVVRSASPWLPGERLHETVVVYYCIDDYAALPDVDTRAVAEMDAHLTCRADQVFVASSLMLEAKRRLKPSTVLAPHGVDVALFRTASDPAAGDRTGRPQSPAACGWILRTD